MAERDYEKDIAVLTGILNAELRQMASLKRARTPEQIAGNPEIEALQARIAEHERLLTRLKAERPQGA